MVLLVEQERLYADELKIVDDATQYAQTSVADWTTKKSVTFTLSKQLIVMIKGTFVADAGSTVTSDVRGAGRITVDAIPIWSTGGIRNQQSAPPALSIASPDIYILLAAGSHTINFDISIFYTYSLGWKIYVTNIYIGQLNFNDLLGSGPWDSGSMQITGSDTTLTDKTITIPAGRQTPIGQIQQYSLFIFAVAKDISGGAVGGKRATHMKNAGESDEYGKVNAKLFLNGTQISWTARANDDADGDTSDNPTYAKGSDGYYYALVSPNQNLEITIKANTGGAGFEQAEAYMIAFLCPWIISPVSYDYSVVDLDFPQGSTFYAYLEPLYVDATKASKIGMVRFKSFGDATDYYSVVSGTGILVHTYTLDVVDVASAQWVVNPSGNVVCISYIAVDVR